MRTETRSKMATSLKTWIVFGFVFLISSVAGDAAHENQTGTEKEVVQTMDPDFYEGCGINNKECKPFGDDGCMDTKDCKLLLTWKVNGSHINVQFLIAEKSKLAVLELGKNNSYSSRIVCGDKGLGDVEVDGVPSIVLKSPNTISLNSTVLSGRKSSSQFSECEATLSSGGFDQILLRVGQCRGLEKTKCDLILVGGDNITQTFKAPVHPTTTDEPTSSTTVMAITPSPTKKGATGNIDEVKNKKPTGSGGIIHSVSLTVACLALLNFM